MNWLLLHSLILGVCMVVIVTSAPTENIKSEKREVKSPEMEDMFSDDIKRKRSQEVIMFGNQQNKPAGMVDAALVGFADKKSDHHQMENDEDDENDDINDGSSDEAVLNNPTEMKNPKETDGSTETKVEGQTSDELGSKENEDEQESGSYLPRSFHTGYQYDELDDSNQGINDKIDNLNEFSDDWLEYGNNQRKRRNIGRYEHTYHKGNLLTPLDKLMNLRHGARWKRDSKWRDDDVLGLLSILAAAEAAKERQAQRKHSLDELESIYAESFAEPAYSRYEDPNDLSDFLDKYSYYPARYTAPDDDNDEDVADIAVYEPDIAINRRSGPLFPPVDYRSLGIIGAKKRNMEYPRHSTGRWGILEGRQRPALREPEVLELADVLGINLDDNDNSDEDEDVERDEEKLYTLGELLNGHDIEESRYPAYRRMI